MRLFKKSSTKEKMVKTSSGVVSDTIAPGSFFERKVVTFEERKKRSYPSANGLYVAEILLLEYCDKYKYPKSEYPRFWWFEYGIKDVNAVLKTLVTRGFIQSNGALTAKGKKELQDNGYVPYMHRSKKKTIDGSPFGDPFNVWSINKLLHEKGGDWRVIVQQEEKHADDIIKAKGKDDPGFVENLDAMNLEKAGKIKEAMVLYGKSIAAGFIGSHPYDRQATYYHSLKLYDQEIAVLQKYIKIAPSGSNKKAMFQKRLENARKLKGGAK